MATVVEAADFECCTICHRHTHLLVCHGSARQSEAGHVVCEVCCVVWFKAQRELRTESDLIPNFRPECPVCKCALRSCGTRGDDARFMGLERTPDAAPATTSEAFTFGSVPPAAVRSCVAAALRGVLARAAQQLTQHPPQHPPQRLMTQAHSRLGAQRRRSAPNDRMRQPASAVPRGVVPSPRAAAVLGGSGAAGDGALGCSKCRWSHMGCSRCRAAHARTEDAPAARTSVAFSDAAASPSPSWLLPSLPLPPRSQPLARAVAAAALISPSPLPTTLSPPPAADIAAVAPPAPNRPPAPRPAPSPVPAGRVRVVLLRDAAAGEIVRVNTANGTVQATVPRAMSKSQTLELKLPTPAPRPAGQDTSSLSRQCEQFDDASEHSPYYAGTRATAPSSQHAGCVRWRAEAKAAAVAADRAALLAMGFDEASVRRALAACDHDVRRAANMLVDAHTKGRRDEGSLSMDGTPGSALFAGEHRTEAEALLQDTDAVAARRPRRIPMAPGAYREEPDELSSEEYVERYEDFAGASGKVSSADVQRGQGMHGLTVGGHATSLSHQVATKTRMVRSECAASEAGEVASDAGSDYSVYLSEDESKKADEDVDADGEEDEEDEEDEVRYVGSYRLDHTSVDGFVPDVLPGTPCLSGCVRGASHP